MINVSFNELAITNEHPAPRIASRPDEVSAFSSMLDKAAIRHDEPAAPHAPEHKFETRDPQTSEPATAAPDKAHVASDVATDHTKPETTPPVKSSPNDEKPQAADRVADTEKPTQDAGTEKSNEKTTTDTSQAVNLAAVVPLLPPVQTLADIQLTFAPGHSIAAVAPQAAAPIAPLPQGDGANLAMPQAGLQTASGAVTPNLPAPSQPSGLDQAMAGAQSKTGETTLPATSGLANMPASIGMVKSETLFAVTSLSQAVMPTTDILPQTSTAAPAVATAQTLTSLPTTSSNIVAMASPTVTALTEKAPALDAATRGTNPAQPDLTTPPSAKTAATSTSQQQTMSLTSLLDGETATITLAQTNETSPGKPLPALANGMISQIGAVLSADGQAKPATTSNTTTIGPLDSLTLPNDNGIQTDIAVTAAPTASAIADQAQQKFTSDGSLINTSAAGAGSHTRHAASTDAVSTVKAPLTPTPVIEQVAVNVAKAAADGLDKINIKLKPASLGQIEVQLEIASDGRIHAVIAADKTETLDLLQRDARALERALGEAGLRTDSNSLSFNLRGQGGQADGSGQSFASFAGGDSELKNNDSLLIGDDERIGAYLNSRAAAGGVDIRV